MENKNNHLLVFSAAWCGPCRMMKALVWSDSSVQQALSGFKSHKFIDIDDVQGQALARIYHIRSVPTIVVTDKEGQPLKVANTMDAKQTVRFLENA
tara:strand:- start:5188 stop:5475 length:288 start_codon:yes stop_codon:yes gene_type:complete